MVVSNEFVSVESDDSVVISGVAGRFAQADNVSEFARKLFEKQDLIDDLEVRWKHTIPGMPRRAGRMNNMEKFDAEFFGISRRFRDILDPQLRLLMEHSYEAILDAGINPQAIRGSRTGVFCGHCFSETEAFMYNQIQPVDGIAIPGCAKSQMAGRLSYALDLRGPSIVVDTACSSSLYALDVAYRSMMSGQCDAAIVAGTNLLINPRCTYQFAMLGVLAKDGYCRPFDKDASGYTRSEAVAVVFLQKLKDAKRVYAQCVYTHANCDGLKPEGITFPSRDLQYRLMVEFYDIAGVKPSTVDYVEAHSTGTVVGDPEECDALDRAFCADRNGPLLVGSVKSSIGHTEAAAGVCSIIKCVIAMNTGMIPPNINFSEARPDIPSLVEGRLSVVHETTPLAGPFMAINSFGFGGANAHALLSRYGKAKKNHGLPDDDLPRLITWTGRTQEAVETMFQSLAQRPLDVEYLALLNNIQQHDTPGHRFRGYGILLKNSSNSAILSMQKIVRRSLNVKPLLFIFGGINLRWKNDLDALRQLQSINRTYLKCVEILNSWSFDLENQSSNMQIVLYDMIGTAVYQLALVNLLTALGFKMNLFSGHSIGQLTCAYLEGHLSLEQVLELVYLHGSVYSEHFAQYDTSITLKIRKSNCLCPDFKIMSGKNGNSISKNKHDNFENYHVAKISCIIPRSSKPIDTILSSKLQHIRSQIHQTANPSSKQWLTATFSKFFSAELHGIQSVEHLLRSIPQRVSLCEPGSSVSLANELKLLNINVSCIGRDYENNDPVSRLLNDIGLCFLGGETLDISQLYQTVQFPVSCDTPMISPHIKWDHGESAFFPYYLQMLMPERYCYENNISLRDPMFSFNQGHCIDGRVLYPAAGYLCMIWEFAAQVVSCSFSQFAFELVDVKFLRATTMPKAKPVNLTVIMPNGTGYFEVLEGTTVVVTGYLNQLPADWTPPALEEQPSTEITLDTKDFYKELRLRGYHYNGAFKSIIESRTDGTASKVHWTGNWTTFLDGLLQSGIVGIDSRSLMVPTAIERIAINPLLHMDRVQKGEDEREYLTVRSCAKTRVTVAGGVVICNPQINTIQRRPPPGVPVLESYQFWPYHSSEVISMTETVRACVQLAVENVPSLNISAVEVHSPSLAEIVHLFGEAVADLPMLQSTLTLLSDQEMEVDNVTVENKSLADCSNVNFLIIESCINPSEEAIECLSEGGYILLRTPFDFEWQTLAISERLNVVASFKTDLQERIILLQRKPKDSIGNPVCMRVQTSDLQWLTKLKEAVKSNPVVLYSQGDPISGIVGLVNCIRKEPKMLNVRGVFIDDTAAPEFDLNDPFYEKQLQLNLAINVFRNGQWGSYRHSLLPSPIQTESVDRHCFANCRTKGDLSSMMWFDGPLKVSTSDAKLVRVSYSSLNFRDVMLATGRLSADALNLTRLEAVCDLGLEFSGMMKDGRRVMGVANSGALATMLECDPHLVWDVPQDWSMEEAATVPVVYGTVYLAFFLCAKIKKGKSILIHAGSGGVGLAAIQTALTHGLEVYTTVGSEEKKEYLLQLFPDLDPENIGNSRNTSFERMIKLRTGGKGVDYVLNSLAEEKLQASVRCLSTGGHFLEIGKFDMANNSKLAMRLFEKRLTFTSVMLDLMFKETASFKQKLHEMLSKAIESGNIKPLRSTVFEANELEKAVRFLASGKHIGKVLLKIRENDDALKSLPISHVPRVYWNEEEVCVIPGGLGGFGLELADWLILRGCRKVVLSSSKGISRSYQEYRIQTWKTYGAEVLISTADITTEAGCQSLLEDASKLGSVSSIFQLAVRLRDAILENQTAEMYNEVLQPKANATISLDKMSRILCPHLKHFVVFSSVSCGRGNAGQSNYGMANSIMERIIEHRKSEGLPAKAIQWGAVGDVGLVADMAEDKIDMEIGGTLQQRITSCLHELDQLLTCEQPIVASMVVAEKRTGSGAKSIVEAVMYIMSIKDLKTISLESSLADMGMDSLMAVEIKQVLERDFEVVLTPQDLRTLTFAKLMKLDEDRKQGLATSDGEIKFVGLQLMIRNLGNEETSAHKILPLKSLNDGDCPVVIIPGIEGVSGNIWITVAEQISSPVYILQYVNSLDCENASEIANFLLDDFEAAIATKFNSYKIVAYSFGCIIALELVKRLSPEAYPKHLLLLDGSPKVMSFNLETIFEGDPSDNNIQKHLIAYLISIMAKNFPLETMNQIMEKSTFEGKIDKMIELSAGLTNYSPQYMRTVCNGLFKRAKMTLALNYDNFEPLNVPMTFVKPTENSLSNVEDGQVLMNFSKQKIVMETIEGNHATILQSPKLIEIINHSEVVTGS